jgi:hypothetical protein
MIESLSRSFKGYLLFEFGESSRDTFLTASVISALGGFIYLSSLSLGYSVIGYLIEIYIG